MDCAQEGTPMRRDWFSQDQQETKDPKKLGSHLSNTEIKRLMRIT